MTDKITVPKQTWDSMREALERAKVWRSIKLHKELFVPEVIEPALTAANAVTSECSKVTSEYSEQPEPPSDENIADAWISASDSDGIAYDGPSFERGYRLGRGEYDEYTGALVAAAKSEAVQPQAQGDASEVSATLAQFGKDGTKDWPEWMRAAAHTATASFPVRSKEMREFDIRGVLAAKLTCWHRMSEADSDALVALFTTHPQATEPAGWKLVPVEPTPEMLDAALNEVLRIASELDDEASHSEIYQAMLAAAPEAP